MKSIRLKLLCGNRKKECIWRTKWNRCKYSWLVYCQKIYVNDVLIKDQNGWKTDKIKDMWLDIVAYSCMGDIHSLNAKFKISEILTELDKIKSNSKFDKNMCDAHGRKKKEILERC